MGRPAKLALHRRGRQNRGGGKLGGHRRAPGWLADTDLAVPARERYSASARGYVDPPRRWRAGTLLCKPASEREQPQRAGPGPSPGRASRARPACSCPRPLPASPLHPGGGGGEGRAGGRGERGGGGRPALPSRPPPSAARPSSAPLPSPFARAAPHGLRAAEAPPPARPPARLDAASPRRAPTCPARPPAVSSAARRLPRGPRAPRAKPAAAAARAGTEASLQTPTRGPFPRKHFSLPLGFFAERPHPLPGPGAWAGGGRREGVRLGTRGALQLAGGRGGGPEGRRRVVRRGRACVVARRRPGRHLD